MNRTRFISPDDQTQELPFLNACLEQLRHWRKVLYYSSLAISLAAISYLIFAPRTYVATTKVMPSPKANQGASLSSRLPQFAMLSSGRTEVNLYLELLSGTPLADSVYADISSTGQQMCGDKTSESSIKAAIRNTDQTANFKSEVITLTTESDDPRLSVAIANGFVDQLDRQLGAMAYEQARRAGQYYRDQIERQRQIVRNVETKRTDFLARNRNYLESDHPVLRVEVERLETELQFNRELLLTMLELQAKNDLGVQMSLPRLVVLERADMATALPFVQRIKFVSLLSLGFLVLICGTIVLWTALRWYIPSSTRSRVSESWQDVSGDARRVIRLIRREHRSREKTGV